MTVAIPDAMLTIRELLVGALHDELQGSLDQPRIVGIVDRVLEQAQVEGLLTALVSADAAITAYAAEVPVPPPAVVAAQATYDGDIPPARDFYQVV